MQTKKFRLSVVISIIYSVFVLLLLGEAERWDLDDMVLPFAVFTAPVWIFWSAVWISPERFEGFFNPKLKDDANNPKRWVYVSEAVAKTHEYYGIGGWALFLAFSYVIGFIVTAYFFLTFIDAFDDVLKAAILLELSIQVFVFYALVTHKQYFQKLFISACILSILLYAGVTIHLNELDPRGIADIVRGLVWIVYVVRSKRINITTRNRYRKREEHLLTASVSQS